VAGPSPASAAPVTIGQLFAPTPGSCGGSPPWTYLQPEVTSGNSYVSPVDGTITSWHFQAGADPVPGLKLKVGRSAGGDDYAIVGESAAPSVAPNSVNDYSANIPVQAGDVIGMSESGGDCSLNTGQPGDRIASLGGDVSPSSTAMTFTPGSGVKFPVQAEVTPNPPPPPPPNAFTFGRLKRNTQRGTATQAVKVPGPGTLSLRGKGIKTPRPGAATASTVVNAAGTVKLLIRATGAKRQRLNRTGTVMIRVSITFTPTGGVANTKSRRIKLIKH
jgi:hypothetical protein